MHKRLNQPAVEVDATGTDMTFHLDRVLTQFAYAIRSMNLPRDGLNSLDLEKCAIYMFQYHIFLKHTYTQVNNYINCYFYHLQLMNLILTRKKYYGYKVEHVFFYKNYRHPYQPTLAEANVNSQIFTFVTYLPFAADCDE